MKSVYTLLLFCTILNVATAQEIFSPKDPGETRNRSYNVLHYRIEVTLHDTTKSVDGKVTTTLVPLLSNLKTIVFDAGDMQIKRVATSKGKNLRFVSTPETLAVDLDRIYSLKDTLSVSIEYSCTPKKGLTFNNTDGAIPTKRPQIWSQGEETTNHYWFPCYDQPNDKSTSEVIATLASKYTLLSNGKLISVKEDKKNKTKTFHWSETKPHSSYLIMIAAGEYTVLHDNLGKLPLEYYVYPDDTTNGRQSFKYTPAMIKFFNETIGVNYPWEKYAQIILQDHFGGMENTSATTLADVWAVSDARARIDNPSTSLLAHELSHQWWGDLVTCKDFRHMWLNESFASYYDPLFHRFLLGQDEFDYTMFENQGAGIRVDTTRGRKPVVSVGSYGENVYPRGSAVLHMLRFVLADEAYHRAIKHYITKFQYQPAETNDLKVAIEEEVGQNLQWFFDEWVYKAGHPIFDVSYRWDDSSKQVMLAVSQVQKIDSLTGLFRTPVDIEITNSAGSTTHRIGILAKDSTYALPSPENPLLVIFDKGNWLLKELRFTKSFDEWKYQALKAKSLVDRLLAVQALARMQSAGDVASILSDRIQHDPFWAVRREACMRASMMMAKSDSLKAFFRPAFLAAMNDPRSQLRVQAAYTLRLYKGSDVVAALTNALKDSSYSVINSTLTSLARVDSAKALPVVKRFLNYPSNQNTVAGAALNALGMLDSAEALTAALQKIGEIRYNALRSSALSIIRKYGKGRTDAMEAVKGILSIKNDPVKNFAVMVLGEIGDASVIPALEAVANDKADLASGVAKQTIEKIKKRVEGKK
jgi:aminopeptidase N